MADLIPPFFTPTPYHKYLREGTTEEWKVIRGYPCGSNPTHWVMKRIGTQKEYKVSLETFLDNFCPLHLDTNVPMDITEILNNWAPKMGVIELGLLVDNIKNKNVGSKG